MTALAKIHVAKKQLGLDDDTYRGLLMQTVGKDSAGKMTEAERLRVVAAMEKRGFKPASKPSAKRAAGPYAAKLRALWIAAWNLGLIRDRSDAALTAFARRQTKIDHTRFLVDPEAASMVIEALKDWMARDAGVNWTYNRFLPAWTQEPGYRIAAAQFALLKRLDPAFAEFVELSHWAIRNVDINFNAPAADSRQWIAVMNALGAHVRKARGQ